MSSNQTSKEKAEQIAERKALRKLELEERQRKDQELKDGSKGCLWIIGFVIFSFLIYKGCETPSDNSSTNHYSTQQEEDNSLEKFSGKIFTYKSKLNDKEFNGETVHTNHETTYHTFDFTNMTVTNKSKLNGKWVSFKYPIKGFYQEKGLAATTYVIVVGTLGVKEIWFSPDVPNIGYDFDDGSRLACYKISRVK